MRHSLILSFIICFIVVSLLGNILVYQHLSSAVRIVGHTTSVAGTVAFAINGTAAIGFLDDQIQFGAGHFNGTCLPGQDYAILNSNTTKVCWVNRTAFPTVEDVHVITNDGTSAINLTVSVADLSDAEQFYCGSIQGCNATNSSVILVASANNETGACVSGLTTGFETLASAENNFTVSICDSLSYPMALDEVKVYVALHLPKDAIPANRTLVLNYQAVVA